MLENDIVKKQEKIIAIQKQEDSELVDDKKIDQQTLVNEQQQKVLDEEKKVIGKEM